MTREPDPPQGPAPPNVARRDFLRTSAAASLAASLGLSLQGCAEQEELFLEQMVGRGNERNGISRWIGGVCTQCGASCGTRVRVVDGDARKIEGLPEHPVSRGGLCAIGQSALQELYDPDRLTGPSSGRDAVGTGLEWAAALEQLTERLRGAGPRAALVTGPTASLTHQLFGELMGEVGGRWYAFEPLWRQAERQAAERVFGWPGMNWDLTNADLVVAFGASPLDRWRNPVAAADLLRGEGARKNGRRRPRLVHVAPRYDLTSAAADLWLAPRLGTESALAMALDEALRDEASAKTALESAASHCDLRLRDIERLVEWMRKAERPVMVAGGQWLSGTAADAAADADDGIEPAARLSRSLADRHAGGVLSAPPGLLPLPRAEGATRLLPQPEDWSQLLGRLRAGEVEVLLCLDVDPLYAADGRAEFAQALDEVFVVALATEPSATTQRADLVLPAHAQLERWSLRQADSFSQDRVWSVGLPAVRPVHDSKHPADVALTLGRELAQEEEIAPWSASGGSKLFDQTVDALLESFPQRDPEGALLRRRAVVSRGYLVLPPVEPPQRPETLGIADRGGVEQQDLTAAITAHHDGGQGPDRFTVLPFESVALADGAAGNRPWLQQLPDPLTTVMWGAWAELAPGDLATLGVSTGDWLELEGPAGSLQLPAVENPTNRPGTIAVPLGSGREVGGRWTAGRGVDVRDLGELRVAGSGRASTVGVLVSARRVERPAGETFAQYGRGLRQHEDLQHRRGRPHGSHGSGRAEGDADQHAAARSLPILPSTGEEA